MKKLFIGSLPPDATEDEVRGMFSQHGKVFSLELARDVFKGTCKGFGFVEMAQISDVAVAFSLLNNSELNGRRIRIEMEPSLKNGKARNRVAARS